MGKWKKALGFVYYSLHFNESSQKASQVEDRAEFSNAAQQSQWRDRELYAN